MIRNLNLEEYLREEFWSATDLKLLRNPLEYWCKRIDPERKERKESDALIFGSALHKLVLEGEDVFFEKYVSIPDFALVSEQQREAAKIDEKTGSEIKAITQKYVKSKWEEENRERHPLKKEAIDLLIWTNKMIKSSPYGDRFTGGFPELSLFWEKDGMKKKARFDYAFFESGTLFIVDLKTYANQNDKNPLDKVVDTIFDKSYHIQAAHYLEAAAECEADLLEYFEEESFDDVIFSFVFVQKGNVPHVTEITIDPDDEVYRMAVDRIENGLNEFEKYMETHGIERPWFPERDEIWLNESLLKPYHYEK